MQCGTDIRKAIDEMERRLGEDGRSVASFCRYADLSPSTWTRWKSGLPTKPYALPRVKAAFERFLANQRSEAA